MPSVPAWKLTQMGNDTMANSRKAMGSHPRGPGSSIHLWNGCAPVSTMWRAVAKTNAHLKTQTTRNKLSN